MELTLDEFYNSIEKNAIDNKIPLFGNFELTGRCNLECVMCYVRKSANDQVAASRELSAARWLEIAKQARDEGMLYALLTGGEIFLRPDFREIYEGMMQLGLIVTLFTNGTLITEEVADWLALSPPRLVSITVYGASEETYKRVTGHSDGFKRVLRALDLLKERNIPYRIKTTIIEGNKRDILPLYRLARKHNVLFGIVNYVFPSRADIDSNAISNRLCPEELVQFEYEIEDFEKTLRVEEEAILLEDKIDQEKVEVNTMDKPNLSAFTCDVGETSFWVNWKGALTPCGVMSEPEILIEDKFNEAWHKLIRVIEGIPSCHECKECSMKDNCLSCPARLFEETGSFEQSAEYLCRYAKERIRIYKD